MRPTLKSPLGPGLAVGIALGEEVDDVRSRVDDGRSGDADIVLDIVAVGINGCERRIKRPVLNGCASDPIDDPYNILVRHKDNQLVYGAAGRVHQRIGVEPLVGVVLVGPALGPVCELGRANAVIGQVA